MELLKVLEKIEEILKNESRQLQESAETENPDNSLKDSAKQILYLVLQFLLSILKAPFNIVARFLKDEIISAVKKDAKLYALMLAIMVVLFVFFIILWLFISAAVGFYFYDKGYPAFTAICYSIVFQLLSFAFLGLVSLIASKRLKSLKILKDLNKYKNGGE
jgi:hypothetical protein